jgi:dihydrofolate synthase/folylpolyglutamate synthase
MVGLDCMMMTYEEALHFWFDRVNFEQKSPLVGDLKLGRMRQLLRLLDNPHQRLRIVHIAGSKGKGSTSAMLGSVLEAAGYRVGLFTSPHLVAVEERIQVNQQPISPAELAALMQDIKSATPADFQRELTFFEIATAAGFLHFVHRRCHFAIVEVGLGGRFDSTNVCQPMLAIITSISFDHTQILGNTLAKIAFEKAGIIKPGIPVISGVQATEPRQVILDACRQRGAPLCQIDEDFTCTHEAALIDAEHERWPKMQVTMKHVRRSALTLGLIGAHQAHNAAIAVAAVEEMRRQGVAIEERALAEGLAEVRWPARLEIMSRRPLVLLDCAHNVASARALVDALRTSFPLPRPEQARRILIFGGNQDKDLAGILELLCPEFDIIYLTGIRNSQRCAPPDELAALVPAATRGMCVIQPSASDAWRQARAQARPGDLICITGSVFLAGELRPVITAR